MPEALDIQFVGGPADGNRIWLSGVAVKPGLPILMPSRAAADPGGPLWARYVITRKDPPRAEYEGDTDLHDLAG